jgi:hypothetical protein
LARPGRGPGRLEPGRFSYGAIEFTKGRLVATPEPKPKPELTIVEKIEAQIRRRQKKPPKSSKTLMNT